MIIVYDDSLRRTINQPEPYKPPVNTAARILARRNLGQFDHTRRTMLLAARIDDAIQAKGWTKKQFAEALGKRPSEVTRWLSGTHNFTRETRYRIEHTREVTLFVVPIGGTSGRLVPDA